MSALIVTPHPISANRQDAPPGERIAPEPPPSSMLEVDREGVHALPAAQIELGRLDMMSTLRAVERKILQATTTGSREVA